MTKRFAGFPKQMPTFFRGLERNNRREWFTPRKESFETHIRAPMIVLVTLLNDAMRKLSADHVADEPAKIIYRIYRDTRFSKDKTPYKTHIAGTFHHRTLSRHGGAGYYFEISHRYVGIAGGVYMPGPEELQTIRAAIARDAKGFLKLVENPTIRKRFGSLQGEKLVRLPKPYHMHVGLPAAEYFKHKNFYWWVELPAALALTSQLPSVLVKHFEAMTPSLEWFNQVLLSERARHADEGRPKRPTPMW